MFSLGRIFCGTRHQCKKNETHVPLIVWGGGAQYFQLAHSLICMVFDLVFWQLSFIVNRIWANPPIHKP